MKKLDKQHISDEYVDAVAETVGVDCYAWDTADPKEIIVAVLKNMNHLFAP